MKSFRNKVWYNVRGIAWNKVLSTMNRNEFDYLYKSVTRPLYGQLYFEVVVTISARGFNIFRIKKYEEI